MSDWSGYSRELAERAYRASRQLTQLTGREKSAWLKGAARALRSHASQLLEANAKDVAAAPEYGLTKAEIDRLTLNESRLEAIASAIEEVERLPDPVGELMDSTIRPNGLEVRRVRVPLGVVFFIYESRPNVTVDAAVLCVKSGNAVILRGGKEALHSNLAFAKVLRDSLKEYNLPVDAVQVVETTERAVVGELLKLNDRISVTIPRGGKSLIERVVAEARMPVIKHFDGVCHVYVDQDADLAMAQEILINSKCQRPGVCNAAECLLVHQKVAEEFLTRLGPELQKRNVELRCCERSRKLLPGSKAATEQDYRTEYLDYILSVRVVDDIDQAMEHIDEYGSHHTETIVTNDLRAAQRFLHEVDSSAVMVNASTRFNDGGELGLGAEIGISTDKLHARGPCGLRELTSYKYVVVGQGQVRG
ncbi:MAG: glutamate-5-semialdehyde dehydrogenase [Planctomycetales bacterium]